MGKSYEEFLYEIGFFVNDFRVIVYGYCEFMIKEVRKFERYFKIKFIESVGEEFFEEKKIILRDYELMFGDIVNIRIKKRKKK